MGGIFSNENEYKKNYAKNYSEDEIKQKIDQLFLNNKANPVSESSFADIPNFDSLDNLDSTQGELNNNPNDFVFERLSKIGLEGGDNKKFTPRGNRYEKYNLKECIKILQDGGEVPSPTTDNYQDLSDFSEFDRIREHMIADRERRRANNDQSLYGGNLSNSANNGSDYFFPEMSVNSPVTPVEKRFNFLELMQTDNNQNFSIENNYQSGGRAYTSETSSAGLDASNYVSDTSVTGNPAKNHSSTQDDIDVDVNIKPFYSSDTSSDYSFQHPYVKNRF